MREKPSRERRPPELTADQEEFYKRMFEGASSEDQDFEPGLSPRLRQEMLISHNIKQFPFSRKHHCEVDISQLPRSGYSYAYYKDTQTFRAHPCLNREWVGLPPTAGSVSTRDKNICHLKLFEIEDEKLALDRAILLLRKRVQEQSSPELVEQLENRIRVRQDKLEEWRNRDALFYASSLDQLYWDARA
jgi:hypothetical protein